MQFSRRSRPGKPRVRFFVRRQAPDTALRGRQTRFDRVYRAGSAGHSGYHSQLLIRSEADTFASFTRQNDWGTNLGLKVKVFRCRACPCRSLVHSTARTRLAGVVFSVLPAAQRHGNMPSSPDWAATTEHPRHRWAPDTTYSAKVHSGLRPEWGPPAQDSNR